jgi:tetratricopeptide (TPR) repeat protein
MALDRKIRVALHLSNAFADPDYEGEDYEKRREQGRKILKESFQQLVRGRNRQNGILGEGEELSAPDSLTKAAESAMRNEENEIAATAVHEFFLQDPPKNQFYCRSLFVKAQLEALKAARFAGDKALKQTQKAIAVLLEALEIMLKPENRPRYDFLIYNVSVHYWRISRQILRPGVMQFVVESMSKIVQALEDADDQDKAWRSRYHMTLAKCYDDAGDVANSMAQAMKALELARDAEEGSKGDPDVLALLESAKRLRIHVARNDGGAAKHVETAASEEKEDLRGSTIVNLQGLKSGILPAEQAEVKLGEILSNLDDGQPAGGDDADENASPNKRRRVFIADLLVEAGRLCVANRLFNLAQSFVDLFERQKGNPGKAGMQIDFLRCELIVESLRDKPRETGRHRRGRHKRDDSADVLKMDKRRIGAMRISRRIEAVKRLERVLMACKRSEDPDLLHEGCVLAWNISMPLLQPHLLKHIHRLFTIAATALEEIDSPLKPLRAKLHFEVAKCEISQDFLAKAATQINKALALDYGKIAAAMEKEGIASGGGKAPPAKKGKKGKKKGSRPGTGASTTPSSVSSSVGNNDALRPLDRFLKPLQAKLELKSNIYKEPDTAVEKATILLEQAKDAKDPHLRSALLQRAVGLLKDAEDANSDETAASPSVERPGSSASRPGTSASTASPPGPSLEELRTLSDGIALWAEIMRMAWSLKMTDIVHESSQRVLNRSWDVQTFKEMVVLQVEACYIKSQCFVEQISMASPNLFEGAVGVDGLRPQALGLTSGNDVPLHPRFLNMKTKVVSLIVQGVGLAKTLNDKALVENGAIYLWNYHHHLFRSCAPSIMQEDDVAVNKNSRLEKMIPSVKDAFVSVLETLQEVGSTDMNLMCCVCEGLGRIFEYEKDGAKVEEICTIGIELGKSRPGVIKPLVACLARAQKIVGGVKGAVGSGEPVLEVIAGVEVLGLSEVPDTEKTGMLTKVMELLKGCRGALMFKESRNEEDVKESSKKTFMPGAAIDKTLEDVEEGHQLWVELWAKVSQCAVDLGCYREAQIASHQAASVLPDHHRDRESISSSIWRWHALAEAVWGTAIVNLIDPTRQERTLREELRVTALTHFCLACRWGTKSNDAKVVLSIARQFWNACVPFVSSALTRRLLQQPLRVVLNKLSEVGEQTDLELRLKLYLVILDCFKDGEDWKNGLDTVDEAFQYIPSNLQKPLWSVRVVFLSKLGGNVAEGLSKMKHSDTAMQAKAWLTLAESSSEENAEMSAYLSAIQCVEGTLDCVECHLEFAQWLYSHRFPRQDVCSYAMAALDLLLDIEDNMDGEEDEELDDHRSNAQSRVSRQTGGSRQTRGSKRGLSRAKSRSSVGSKARSSTRASTSALSSTVIASDDGDGVPKTFDVGHLEQIIRAFVILARVSTRADERSNFFVLAHRYVVKLMAVVIGAMNDRRAADAHASLTEEEQEEKPFSVYKNEAAVAFSCPSSDVEWAGYTVTDEFVEEMKKAVPEACMARSVFASSDRAVISSTSIQNFPRAYAFFNDLSTGLIEHGHQLLACSVLATLQIMVTSLGGLNTRALQRLVFMKMAINYDSLNLRTMAKTLFQKCTSVAPDAEELALFEEDISQREQAILEDNTDQNGEASNVAIIQRKNAAMHRKKVQALHVRHVWIDLARLCCRLGMVNGAKELLVEAMRHSKAYLDQQAIAVIYQIQGLIAESEGAVEQSLQLADDSINKSVCTVSVYQALESILRRASIYESSRRQSKARTLLTEAVAAFQNLSELERTGLDVGIGILKKRTLTSSPSPPRTKGRSRSGNAGMGGDLDYKFAVLKCKSELTRLEGLDAASLKSQGSPWKEEWKRCNSGFLEVIEKLEKLGYSVVLPGILSAYADATLEFGVDGTKAVLGLNEDDTSVTERTVKLYAIELLERAKVHAENNFSVTSPVDVSSSLAMEISVPSSRSLVGLKVRLAQMYIQLSVLKHEKVANKEQRQRMDLRRMNAARADGSGGPTIIDKWLDATAPKPPVTAEEKQISHCGKGVVLASSAHAVGGRVSCLRAKTMTMVGRAVLHSAQIEGELVGAWLPSGNADPDEREEFEEENVYCAQQRLVSGDSLRKQAEKLLLRAVDAGVREERWDLVENAADSLVTCYGAIDPVEGAKAMMLRQSCRISQRLFRMFKTACDPTNRELLFFTQHQSLHKAFLHPDVNFSYNQNHAYLSATSDIWNKLYCGEKVDQMLEKCPSDTCFFLCDLNADSTKMFAAVLRRDGEGTVHGATSMHALDESQRSDLLHLINGFESWKKRLAKFLLRYGPTCGPSGDRDLVGERTAETNDTYEQEFQVLRDQMEDLLRPVLQTPAITEVWKDESVKQIVLLPDWKLSNLPLESMKMFRQPPAAAGDVSGLAPVLCRDFSLHVVYHRLMEEGAEAPGSFNNTAYIVDPQHEDKKGGNEDDNGLGLPKGSQNTGKVDDPEATGQSIETFEVHSAPAWAGVKGSEHAPSAAEWQQYLTKSKNQGMFVFYGFGNMLSYFNPQRLVGMRLGGCRLALLFGGSATDGSYRRQGKLDNQKLAEMIELERPIETAALLTLCGVSSIATNVWSTSPHANRRAYLTAMPALKSGKPVADCLHEKLRSFIPKNKSADNPNLKERVRYSMVVYGLNTSLK